MWLFLLHNTLRLPEGVHKNLKTLAPIGAEKYATEIFIGEKEIWTNKKTDKHYVAGVFWLHNTAHPYQA